MEDIKFPCMVKALQDWLDAAAAVPENADLPIDKGIPNRVAYFNRMARSPGQWRFTELKMELLVGLLSRTQMCDYHGFSCVCGHLMSRVENVDHECIDLERGLVLLPSHPYKRDNN